MLNFYHHSSTQKKSDETVRTTLITYNDARFNFKKFIKILVLLSLVGAYATGYFFRANGSINAIKHNFPDGEITKVGTTPPAFKITFSGQPEAEKLLVIGRTNGWGGPLETGAVIGKSGNIEDVLVLSHKETPTFYKSLVRQRFFQQFSDKALSAPLIIGKDIDAVGGATVSSKAFAKAVRLGAHWVGRHEFNMEIDQPPEHWQIGANEFILIVLYAIVILGAIKKFSVLRKIVLLFSLGFIGFYMNSPISVSNFSAILLGYFPAVYEQTFWWLLVVGTLLLTVIYGRNLYCSWMCPFGAMQEFITLIGGVRLRLNKKIIQAASYSVYFFFWLALMIAFLTSNPALAAYEPFATLFGFKGSGVQWYLVSVAVIGSFIIPRFWCRFFCPVGAILTQVLKLKKALAQKIRMGVNLYAK
jgi:Na+-translocating ferredoxin:NAD+ oxidoreductase RnfG subunit